MRLDLTRMHEPFVRPPPQDLRGRLEKGLANTRIGLAEARFWRGTSGTFCAICLSNHQIIFIKSPNNRLIINIYSRNIRNRSTEI